MKSSELLQKTTTLLRDISSLEKADIPTLQEVLRNHNHSIMLSNRLSFLIESMICFFKLSKTWRKDMEFGIQIPLQNALMYWFRVSFKNDSMPREWYRSIIPIMKDIGDFEGRIRNILKTEDDFALCYGTEVWWTWTFFDLSKWWARSCAHSRKWGRMRGCYWLCTSNQEYSSFDSF